MANFRGVAAGAKNWGFLGVMHFVGMARRADTLPRSTVRRQW